MRILIVDDNAAKVSDVRTFLESAALDKGVSIRVDVASYLGEAARLVASASFEMIILDLMLPYLRDGQPDSRAGQEMLRQIRDEESRNIGAVVIGVSAYPGEVSGFRESFERAGVLIVSYDDAGTWRVALAQTFSDVLRRQAMRQEIDFLILTALEEERAGFNSTNLVCEGDAIVAGLNVRYVQLACGGRQYKGAIIKLRQMGLVAATLDSALALTAFNPRIICMSGICAGFADHVTLGQLVLASPAWEYQAGKWSDNNFQIAPTQIPLPARTRVIADQALSSDGIQTAMESALPRNVVRPSKLRAPVLAPAATGSAVIADATKLSHIQLQHRKIAALDMETFGLYYSAHEVNPPPEHFFSLKCVVDMADADKSDNLHEYGCVVAARATIYLIDKLLDG